MKFNPTWRWGAMALGVAAAGLGCKGAYEFALKLEGGEITYLVLAAPVVAAAAALIPPLAEFEWRRRYYLKSFLWWLVLAPAAATVFFASAERVHIAKAGAEAERIAMRNAASRAESELKEAKAEFKPAEKAWNKVKDSKKQGPTWLGLRADFDSASKRVEEVEKALVKAEAKAAAEADLKEPVWLRPASLDLIAFMAIWTALTGPRPPKVRRQPRNAAKRKSSKRKPSKRSPKFGERPQVVVSN